MCATLNTSSRYLDIKSLDKDRGLQAMHNIISQNLSILETNL